MPSVYRLGLCETEVWRCPSEEACCSIVTRFGQPLLWPQRGSLPQMPALSMRVAPIPDISGKTQVNPDFLTASSKKGGHGSAMLAEKAAIPDSTTFRPFV